MKKTFLEYVAEDLLKKFGTDLSRVTLVFPNKRASLFIWHAWQMARCGVLFIPPSVSCFAIGVHE